MPARLAAYKKFQWTEADDGTPICHVASFGGICYVMVCSLCGCLHQTDLKFDMVGQTAPYTPRCLLREFAGQKRAYGQTAPWQAIYADWLSKHPKAADFSEIRAVYIGRGSELEAPYEGVMPHSAPPAVSIVAVREQERQEKPLAKEQRWRKKSRAA